MTISCDIGLAPKQTASQYKLTSLYGQCNIPSRSSSRKRRSEPDEEDFSKINISKTFNISSKSNEKSNAFRNHSFSVALIIIGMFLLWCLLGTHLQNEELLYSSWLILNDWFSEYRILFSSLNIRKPVSDCLIIKYEIKRLFKDS